MRTIRTSPVLAPQFSEKKPRSSMAAARGNKDDKTTNPFVDRNGTGSMPINPPSAKTQVTPSTSKEPELPQRIIHLCRDTEDLLPIFEDYLTEDEKLKDIKCTGSNNINSALSLVKERLGQKPRDLLIVDTMGFGNENGLYGGGVEVLDKFLQKLNLLCEKQGLKEESWPRVLIFGPMPVITEDMKHDYDLSRLQNIYPQVVASLDFLDVSCDELAEELSDLVRQAR